jgi:hypothetical protein
LTLGYCPPIHLPPTWAWHTQPATATYSVPLPWSPRVGPRKNLTFTRISLWRWLGWKACCDGEFPRWPSL